MKKLLFPLIAVAALFIACDKNEVLVDTQEAPAKAIGFDTFAQSATRAENSCAGYNWVFFNHHDDFQVWGYKDVSTNPVFSGDVVTVTQDGTKYKYTYSPLRYWDKSATTYQYYAAAPAGTKGGWTFVSTGITNTSTQDQGYFTTSAALAGTNLSTATETGYVQSFKAAAGDVDKMIADKCAVANAQFGEDVDLKFIHILSRLNVTIKKDDVLSSQTVVMKKLEVANLNSKGNFSEATAAVQTGSYGRWSSLSTPIVYTAVANTTVTTTAKHVLQSLVIPQESEFEAVALNGSGVGTSSKPYLVITYSIADGTNPAEEFTAYYNLANAFGMDGTSGKTEIAFNEGWQNTLNIILKPSVIQFCAEVAEWSNNLVKDLTIQ